MEDSADSDRNFVFETRDVFSYLYSASSEISKSIAKSLWGVVWVVVVFELIRGANVKEILIQLPELAKVNSVIDYRFILCILPLIFSVFYYMYSCSIKRLCDVNLATSSAYKKFGGIVYESNLYQNFSGQFFFGYNLVQYKKGEQLRLIAKYWVSFLPFIYFVVNVLLICVAYFMSMKNYDCDWIRMYSSDENFALQYSFSWFLCKMKNIQIYSITGSVLVAFVVVSVSVVRLARCLVVKNDHVSDLE